MRRARPDHAIAGIPPPLAGRLALARKSRPARAVESRRPHGQSNIRSHLRRYEQGGSAIAASHRHRSQQSQTGRSQAQRVRSRWTCSGTPVGWARRRIQAARRKSDQTIGRSIHEGQVRMKLLFPPATDAVPIGSRGNLGATHVQWPVVTTGSRCPTHALIERVGGAPAGPTTDPLGQQTSRKEAQVMSEVPAATARGAGHKAATRREVYRC